MKRYIYIILAIIVLAAIAIVAIFFFRKQSLPSGVSGLLGSLPFAGTQTIATSTGGSTTTSPQGSATSSSTVMTNVVSNETAIAYFVSPSDIVVTVQPAGTIEMITGAQSTYLSSSAIANVLSASFSYDGQKILVSSGDPLKPLWSVFDIKTKIWTPLPANPITAAWAPSSYQIAYFASVNGVSALETIDLSAKNAKPKFISAFPNEDFQLLWKSPSDIILADRASALFSGSIFDINIKTGVISTVVVTKVGLETQWNSSGTMAVIFVGTQLARGGQLGIINNNGDLIHQMTFLTLPSKCVFPPTPAVATSTTATTTIATSGGVGTSTKNIFSSLGLICAIPRDADTLNNNPLPDAYNEKIFLTSDDFYTVSLNNGNTAPLLVDGSQNFDVSDIQLSNDKIYFINRYDQKLYALTPVL